MTVAELIAHLQTLPQDAEVIGYYDGAWGYCMLTNEAVFETTDSRIGPDKYVAIEV